VGAFSAVVKAINNDYLTFLRESSAPDFVATESTLVRDEARRGVD